MPTMSPDTLIHDLLEDHPFLLDFLVDFNPKFSLLKDPTMRANMARIATLRMVSDMGGIDLDRLLEAIENEVKRVEGDSSSEAPSEPVDSDKVAELKGLIVDLHEGVDPETARARFNSVVKDVSPKEIGAMEEQLIREGMPVEEIQRLCDLHVAVVKDSLEGNHPLEASPGHPIHTYLEENEVITAIANRLGELCGDSAMETWSSSEWESDLRAVLEKLRGIDNHYLRKENELFPILEKHGVTGPSQVMWGIHDEVRAQAKEVQWLLDSGANEEAASLATSLARSVVEMVYKENKILLPLARQTLTIEEWADVRRGEDELGYAFHEPTAPFPFAEKGHEERADPAGANVPAPPQPRAGAGIGLPIVSTSPPAPLPEASDQAYVDLGTGRLSLEQVDMMLRHLPIEISFVDAEGFVRYYSDTEERLFPRTPGAIGRHVENCHPPKSVHMVKEILRKFSTGERDLAEFWIQMQGKFIHIRYFAVRNQEEVYLGCLEVTQDVTQIRDMEGQRRLLEWS